MVLRVFFQGLGFVLVSVLIFFAFMTQRMMIKDENAALETLSKKEWLASIRQSSLGQRAVGLQRWVANHSHLSDLSSLSGTIGSQLVRLENAENQLLQTFSNLGVSRLRRPNAFPYVSTVSTPTISTTLGPREVPTDNNKPSTESYSSMKAVSSKPPPLPSTTVESSTNSYGAIKVGSSKQRIDTASPKERIDTTESSVDSSYGAIKAVPSKRVSAKQQKIIKISTNEEEPEPSADSYGEVVALRKGNKPTTSSSVDAPGTPQISEESGSRNNEAKSSPHVFKGTMKVKQYQDNTDTKKKQQHLSLKTSENASNDHDKELIPNGEVTKKSRAETRLAKQAALKAEKAKAKAEKEKDNIGFGVSSSSSSSLSSSSSSHPNISPRVGTDISTESHQLALLRCHNQSQCIVPELQLQKKMKIYYCRHPVRSGVRFYFLMREGLLLHPNVQLVEESEMHTADYVIYLPGSAPWHKTECTNVSLASKMIVMDEFDGPTLFFPRKTSKEVIEAYGSLQWYFMYYKRSFVNRQDGKFLGFPHFRSPDVYPMTYALAEVYTQHKFNFQREIEILCTLRGSAQMMTRQRVQEWIAEYGISRKVKNLIGQQVNGASRTSVSKQYFEQMYNSQIIVTVNPAHWEGDFRLWESFATGALVMVDPLFVPHTNPLIDKVHVVYFSNDNKTDLFYKLDYYRQHKDEARKIAINGYLHTMKYHRTVNLVDYVLRSAHLKRATLDGEDPLPKYRFTAQYINKETKKQEKEIKHHKRPVQLHAHGTH